MSQTPEFKFTPSQVGAAMTVLAGALRDLPDPKPSFDVDRIDYLIPETLRSRAEGAVHVIMAMGALMVFEPALREAVEAERERILNQVKAALE